MEYWHIDTGGSDDAPDSGLLKRQQPQHRGITDYIGVTSVDESAAKIEKLGGKICLPKTAVPR
jgi:predicted enzyme related to lactoylglutathione lyase